MVSGLRSLHQGGIRVIGQVGLVLVMLGGSLVGAQVEGLRFFEEKIRPLLSENCFECHGPEKQKAGLRLDGRGFVLKGGENGPAIVVGNPGESLLIEAVSYRSSDLEMPPKRKLGKRQVEDLTRWVAMGAPWPVEKGAAANDQKPGQEFRVTEEDRSYWAFRPLREGGEKHFDEIIESVLREKELVANPVASREVLVRRAYYALIGLPPTFAEVRAFVEDPDPEAFSKLVDRLLAMPEYGERWGRHWLDVVRFAQSNGYERDDEKPNAWRYRDYVISSFNQDKPYNRFVMEQIAGDELPDGGDEGWIATGFHRLGVWDDEPDDKRAAEFDGQDDILKTTTETFLGLTVGCARCHDHMFDPISQRNYYELLSFFRNVKPYNKPGGDTIRKTGSGEALVVTERGNKPIETHILIRGNAGRPGDRVEPHFPEILGGGSPAVTATPHSVGRRRAFASWVVRRENPLTARVMVNRLWHGHFGRGIVATPNDFGKAGSPPSNVALLDWLAREFMTHGWSIKHLHRVIMNSRAWQRSSAGNAGNETIDPGNLHHWRANLRRLESEAIRDSILKSSGALNSERGGRGFFPALAGEVVAGASKPGRNWQWSLPEQQRRRSVYAFVKRTMLYPFFEIFDYTNTEGSLGVRPTTTVAPQALLLLNSEFVAENAGRLAEKALAQPDPVSSVFRMVLSRNPTEEEHRLGSSFLTSQEKEQERQVRRISFRPDFPPALFNDYQKSLPAGRFLRGPDTGWEYHKGKWTGGYEGIVNAERDWPAYALYGVSSGDVMVSGRFLLDGITERSSVLLRARPGGGVFDGYSVLLDKGRGEIAILRHQGEKITTLSKRAFHEFRKELDIAITLQGGSILVSYGSKEPLKALDPDPIGGEGRVGVSAWGGEVSIDGLTIVADGRTYGVAEIDYAKSRFSDPEQLDPQAVLPGWSSYGGNWSSRENMISVAREKGPKLLWEAAGVLGDGDSLKAEVRIEEGSIAGLLLNVREPKTGADNWIGYEVSLYLDEGKLVVGTHNNNWVQRAEAPAALKRGEWHWLEARTTGNRLQVFLDNRPEPYIDHMMEQPLAAGLAGLRTWGAQVHYRNVHVSRGGEKVTWAAPEAGGRQEDKTLLVHADREATIRQRALAQLCSLLLNLNEFVYID